MNNHSPSSDRRSIVTEVGAAVVALALVVTGCNRSSASEPSVEPVASTIDISEPVVVVQGGDQDESDAQLTVSEAVPDDADQVATDQFVVADDVITLPPDRVEELLASDTPSTTGKSETTTPNTAATESTSTVTSTSSPVNATAPGPTTTGPPSTDPPLTNPGTTIATATIPAPDDAIQLDPLGRIPGGEPDTSDEPVEILQYNPVGEVQTAPYVTVTFNQPMKTLDGIRPIAVPITIEPRTVGSWRWLGDRTVRFEPADAPDGRIRRFAAATLYRVTVSGDIESANGEKLGTDTSWQFATPPPTVLSVVGAALEPADAPQVDTTPVFVVRADQRIDAERVVESTTLTANGETLPMRAATDAEIEGHLGAADAVGAIGEARTAVITPVDELPAAAELELTIGPNLASSEGELLQPEAVSYFARTLGTPQIVSNACVPTDCSAGASLEITLNNPLDVTDQSRADLARLITVTPAIPGLEINVVGSKVTLVGDTAADTEYTVTLAAGLRDVFGQTLPSDAHQTFDIGNAHPFFNGPRSEMVILDPEAASPTLAVQSINHDKVQLTVWAVTTADFEQYQELRALGDSDTATVPETWQRLSQTTIDIDRRANQLVTTQIDLDDELDQAGSQLVVLVAPDPEVDRSDPFAAQNRPLWTWVQRTSLGVDAIADESTLMIWTTDLRTGKPVTGIPVSLIGDSRVATTDEEGIQVIKLTDEPIKGLIADDGTQVTYLPAPSRDGWKISAATQQSRWEVLLDGTTYRPGDQVRMTGWMRGLDPRADRLLITPDEDTEVTYTVLDAGGQDVASGSTTINRRGGFSANFELPADVEFGPARILLRSGASSTVETFDVTQFLSAEFGVALQRTGDGPIVAGTPLPIGATASYTNGSPVANASVRWSVNTAPATYRPPRWPDYTFGLDRTTPNTANYGSVSADPAYCADCPPVDAPKEVVGTTDGTGSHGIEIDVEDPDGLPVTVSAAVDIDDDDHNPSSASTTKQNHPAELYVGLKTDTLFTELGEPIEVDAVVTDVSGARVDREVTINLKRVVSTWRNGEWVRSPEPVDGCVVGPADPSAQGGDQSESALRCTFEARAGGEYLIDASVVDESGHRSRTELTRWVSGALALPSIPQQLEQATVIPDKERYAPGDTARLLIGAPWAPARGVVVLSRYNIEERIPFETEDGSVIVEVPITDRSVPNVTGWVTMLGTAPRLDADGSVIRGETRPAVASGRIDISVPATEELLNVEVRPESAVVRPGDDTTVTVDVTNTDGEPVADAQVAVIVGDESALAQSGYQAADPSSVFYAGYPGELLGISSRQYVQLLDTRGVDPNPEVATIGAESTVPAPNDATDTVEDAATSDSSVTSVADASRTPNRIAPLALYSTENFTDDSGSVSLSVRVPDSSTQLIVAAVAVGPEQRFGSGNATLTSGQPLDVRIDPPDFVRVGDQVELPVVLTNHTAEPVQVAAAVEVSGLVLADGVGQQVTVEPGSTLELRYKIRATEIGSGQIRLVTEASSTGSGKDILTRTETSVAVPVHAPATARSYVSAGVLRAGDTQDVAVQRVFAPATFEQGFGGLDVSVSTSAMSTLADVAEGLAEPTAFTSNTKRASRIIGAAAILDHPVGVDSGADADALSQEARQSFQRLLRAKNTEGWWSEWPRRSEADVWVTVIAAEAVLTGLDAKWGSLSDEDRATMLAWLADIQQHIPSEYPANSRNLVRAYAIHVLRHAGGDEAALAADRADDLFDETGDDIQPDAAALIWSSLTTTDRRERVAQLIADRADANSDGVRFANDYSSSDYPVDWSQPRVDATVLAALIEVAPDSELIEPALDALLAERTDGTWGNAQADAAAVRAVGSYVRRYEPSGDSAEPSSTRVQAWVGSRKILDGRIAAGETASTSTRLANIAGADSRIVVARTGAARLYVRSRLTYAVSPTGALRDSQAATDDGFVVERSYEPILDPSDVVQMADGSWRIKRGVPVRVRLVMVTDAPHTNVILSDHLPAGLTPVSPSLTVAQGSGNPTEVAGTSAPTNDATSNDYSRWSGWNWFDHQQLGSNSTDTEAETLDAGSYEYIYVARATTPGRFVAPGAVADATYDSTISGRTRSDEVVVE